MLGFIDHIASGTLANSNISRKCVWSKICPSKKC